MKSLTCRQAIIRIFSSVKSILERNKSHLNGLNTFLILMLAIAFAGQKMSLEPVVFSKGLAIATLAKELNDKGVSDARQRLLVNRFARALPYALAHYAEKHHVVILNDKEVVAGAPNITSEVLAYIAGEMSKQNEGPGHD